MTGDRQKGFEVSPHEVLYTARSKDGLWSAWVEDQARANPCDQTIKIFEGGSAYQAQIKAIRWMSRKDQEAARTSLAPSP